MSFRFFFFSNFLERSGSVEVSTTDNTSLVPSFFSFFFFRFSFDGSELFESLTETSFEVSFVLSSCLLAINGIDDETNSFVWSPDFEPSPGRIIGSEESSPVTADLDPMPRLCVPSASTGRLSRVEIGVEEPDADFERAASFSLK